MLNGLPTGTEGLAHTFAFHKEWDNSSFRKRALNCLALAQLEANYVTLKFNSP